MILEGIVEMLSSGRGKSDRNSAFAWEATHMSIRTKRVRLTVPRSKMTKFHLPALLLAS